MGALSCGRMCREMWRFGAKPRDLIGLNVLAGLFDVLTADRAQPSRYV
jgi:hypothetical protein